MGKAENNFENKWLEEREDGFFYTMKRLSLKDTQEINGWLEKVNSSARVNSIVI